LTTGNKTKKGQEKKKQEADEGSLQNPEKVEGAKKTDKPEGRGTN